MSSFVQLCLLLCLFWSAVLTAENISKDQELKLLSEKKISDYVHIVLEHYKKADPVGLPIMPIPEPFEIPPLSHSFSIGKMHFQNVKVHGLSKFRIDHITADLAKMQVEAAFRIDVVYVLGNYTLSTWISSSQGPFTIQLSDLFAEATAKLEVQSEGKLEAQEMNMDVSFKNIAMNFEQLGFFASVFQGVLNSVGSFVFDSIKPYILSEFNTNVRSQINEQVHELPLKFPNSISPFDQLITEARHKVRSYNYDPFKLDDYNYTASVFGLQMTHTWLLGLSSFHRVGNMTFEIRNNTLYLQMEIGTQKLEGSTHWEVSVIGISSRSGTASFSVEYLQVKIEIGQSLDTRNSPILNDLQLELGNIQVRCDGAGTLDYVIEFAVNVIPNLLRFQIMDALESPIKMRIQEALDTINVEQMVHENLPKLDELEKNGFKGMLEF